MKTTRITRLAIVAFIMVFTISANYAQNPTPIAVDTMHTMDSTPAAPPAAAPAPAPAAAPAPKPEKEKKDGFNSHTRFGIRVGGIISRQEYEGSPVTEDPESKFGADLAILCAIPIGGGFFMLQPEIHWMQKGYKIEDADIYGDVTSTLNYLEVPLLARVNFGGSVKLFAFAGPSVGYLLSGTYEDELNGEKDVKDYLDDVEYSGHIGVGVGLGTLEVDLRYIAGLSDISDSGNLSDVKNSSFGVGVTLKF